MLCPYCEENHIEPGPNCRIKVEHATGTIAKMVCEDCADMFKEHLQA